MQLTLLLDQGEEAQGQRWQSTRTTFHDLHEVLAQVLESAIVVLGPPGSGKSTLLRHFEWENAQAALREKDRTQIPLTLFVSLNEYGVLRGQLPEPLDWLKAQWAACFPDLPPLDTLLRERQVTLLLDALNEMPVSGAEPVQAWRAFVRQVDRTYPRTRVVFSCRSLDYSALLSSKDFPVPQVRVEVLSDAQVEEFVRRYCPAHGETLWQNLRGTPQLEILRSPYYLKLLVDQATSGDIPQGHAALFSGFVRHALEREIVGNNDRLRHLVPQDIQQWFTQRAWNTPFALPEAGGLFPQLSALAFRMQSRRTRAEAAQVRVAYGDALALLADPQAADILKAGVDLGVLEHDLRRQEILYVHQLLQEYFAARHLAQQPSRRRGWTRWLPRGMARRLAPPSQGELVQQAWRAGAVRPGLPATLKTLADSDPLPPLPSTGWEETMLLAVAMADDPARVITALMAHNLPLAGRCAAQPGVAIAEALKEEVRWALVQRTQEPAADLRARIAAGLALGELGDPRFSRHEGPYGPYLLPPMIEIPGGTYRIGSDEGLYSDEAPMHDVTLDAFAIAQFPVTNAEWALFMQAGGYEEERWWETEAAQAWRRGEDTAEGPKQQWRENRKSFQGNFDAIRQLQRDNRITSKQADDWEAIARMTDDAFEVLLDGWYPPGRQTQPGFWNDTAFNNAAQPVVGICWLEARAYCAWLSAQTGQRFRLPTEVEWEAAARGLPGRRYAFGHSFDATRCNTFETHIRRSTPIGVFPGGATPEGVVDLTGNVWEWTSSQYQSYPYDTFDNREYCEYNSASRVLLGGAWPRDQVLARASFRYRLAPGFRNYHFGLRLVQSSPILP